MIEIREFLLDLFRKFALLSRTEGCFFSQKGVDVIVCRGSVVEFKHQTDKGFQLISLLPTNLRELLVLLNLLLTSENIGVVLYYCKLYNVDLKPESEEEVEIKIRKPDGMVVERIRL